MILVGKNVEEVCVETGGVQVVVNGANIHVVVISNELLRVDGVEIENWQKIFWVPLVDLVRTLASER